MKLEEIAGVIIRVLQEVGLPFMVVGGLSSNVYRIARSTKDVDIVIRLKTPGSIPTGEDVVVQKLRWGRPKDLEDVRGILTVQGPALDYAHIEDWCGQLNILDRYHAVRATVPEI